MRNMGLVLFRTVFTIPVLSDSVLGEVQCSVYVMMVSLFLSGTPIKIGKKYESPLSVCNSVQPLDGINSLLAA